MSFTYTSEIVTRPSRTSGILEKRDTREREASMSVVALTFIRISLMLLSIF